jgi:hypothetical protein
MRLAVTVRFDVIWRRPGGGDAVLATTTHDFAPNPPGPAQFDAIRFDADLDGAAVAASAGDLLVLRFTTTSGAAGAYYIPNGDGALVNGRTVNLTLP